MSEIKLTQGKVALVDDGDVESLSRFTWHAHNVHGSWYAMRSCNYRVIQLGRFVDKEEAIRVRREAQQAMFGEFARS